MACEDEELKIPADFQLDFGVQPQTLRYSEDEGSYSLKITQADLFIKQLEFEGVRESGDNINFDKTFSESVAVALLNSKDNDSLHFKIPQGIYTHMALKVTLAGKGGEAPFQLRSELKSGQNEFYDLHFNLGFEERIDINVKPAKEQEKIVVDKKQTTRCRIDFKPLFIMSIVEDEDFNYALFVEEDGKYIIPISDERNSFIYSLLANRFARAFEARIILQ